MNQPVKSTWQDYITAIETLTPEIDQLTFELTKRLEKRAMVYAKMAKFDKAMGDAEIIMQYAPTSCRGYLLAGIIYEEQGKITKADEIYKIGQEKVLHYDDGYSKLSMKINFLQKKCDSSNRIKLVDILPAEVIHSIFCLLSIEDRVTCSEVCQSWQQAILNTPLAPRESKAVLHRMKNESFPRAQSLTVTSWLFKPNDATLHHRRLLSALEQLSGSLTELDVSIQLRQSRLGGPVVSVATIISSCKRLRHLKITTNYWCRAFISANEITNLVRSFPEIQTFNLNTIRPENNSWDFHGMEKRDLIMLSQPPVVTSDIPGLGFLRVFVDHRNTHQLSSALDQTGKSLQALYLIFCCEKDDSPFEGHIDERWTPFTTWSFNPVLTNMTKLYCIGCNLKQLQNVICIIIQNSPALEQVVLEYHLDQNMDQKIVDALTNLCRLHMLEIHGGCSHTSKDQPHSLVSLFKIHGNLGIQSPLRTLYFTDTIINDVLLQIIPTVQTLQEIQLHDYHKEYVSKEGMNAFATELKYCDGLQKLVIHSDVGVVSDTTLEALCEVPSLTSLSLYDSKNVTLSGIHKLFEGSSSFKELMLKDRKF
ncbi:hypothetical protein BDA99DRAFT_606350 [Phascolomyces articulosus]|uniref:F-box domain-containing protein n=1 Tax=Phascolomyces articulosus TaxID=60185 RepID=A0AAD5K798_9FUNG|nr:hypothetical protein BDA99DRAFT_606350 [Phascolomyces articulosus]